MDCNIALVRMLGYESKEELLQIAVPQVFVDSAERREQVRNLQQSAAIRCQEVRLRRKDGSVVICLDTARAICDDSGELVRLLITRIRPSFRLSRRSEE